LDFAEIKHGCLMLRELLRQEGVAVDGIILFGSRAKGTHRPDSDIDLCVISRNFGKDRFEESVLAIRLASKCLPFSEVVSVGVTDYLEAQTLSPILHEIKKTGILIL
jgi:uncharacterized protein